MNEEEVTNKTVEDWREGVELFLSEDGTGHATLDVEDHVETHAINSNEFSRLVRVLTFRDSKVLLDDKGVREAVEMFNAQAQVQGVVFPVYRRVATFNNKTYIDVGDAKWSVIEVDPTGYRVLRCAPGTLKFLRAPGMQPLPFPEKGGTLNDFRSFINLQEEPHWYLLLCWTLAALHPVGPYAILVLNGEAGSAKSTLTSILRSLIDPNVAPLRSLPKSERDLFISSQNSWLTAIDNISYLSDAMADAFCRLSTRGAFVTRKLYTDSREQFFDVCCPSLFNGIQEFCFRTDFADRSIQLTLSRISDEHRKRSQVLMSEFDLARPKIFGVLLETLSATMREFPNVKVTNLPRMADFAFFASAVERAVGWQEGVVMGAYEVMRKRNNESIIESCPFSAVIFELARREWDGTATELMHQIEVRVGDSYWQKRGFPKSPGQLSGQLRRLAPAFRSRGIEVNCDGKTAGSGSQRFITLSESVPDKKPEPFIEASPIPAPPVKKGRREARTLQ